MPFLQLIERQPGRRDVTPSAKCLSICEMAQQRAEDTGKTSELCDTGSSFRAYYSSCAACCSEELSTDEVNEYLSSAFGEYLAYCNSGEIVQTITRVISTTFGANVVAFTTITTAITLNANSTVTPTDTSTSSVPTSGQETSLNPAQPAGPTAEPTAGPSSSPESKAWVAGPIAGSIAGVIILALVAFFFHRRRRLAATINPLSEDYTDKPQLHSDCVPQAPPDELDAGMRHELPGHELRDESTMVTELPGKDPKILDKTYGRSELPSYETGQLPG